MLLIFFISCALALLSARFLSNSDSTLDRVAVFLSVALVMCSSLGLLQLVDFFSFIF
jgi:hypothetical protein